MYIYETPLIRYPWDKYMITGVNLYYIVQFGTNVSVLITGVPSIEWFRCTLFYLSVIVEMYVKRELVVAKLQEFEEQIEPVVNLFEDPEVAEHMKREDQNLFDYLAQNHEV